MIDINKDLVKRVQSCGDGASVHTRNKAICYYCYAKTTPKLREELETLMQEALGTGDWSILKQRMRRWF